MPHDQISFYILIVLGWLSLLFLVALLQGRSLRSGLSWAWILLRSQVACFVLYCTSIVFGSCAAYAYWPTAMVFLACGMVYSAVALRLLHWRFGMLPKVDTITAASMIAIFLTLPIMVAFKEVLSGLHPGSVMALFLS